jgi:hypothetical protein
MSPEGQLLMNELQRLFKEQTQLLDRRFSDAEHSVEQRIIESETRLDGRLTDSESRLDSIITESKRLQDVRLTTIEKVARDLEAWRQDAAGALDDMRLKVLKLDKAWDRSVIEQSTTTTGLISTSPGVEQTDKPPSAVETAARPSGHDVDT